MGLRRRRHFLTEGRRVLDLEDELFAPGGSPGAAETLGLSGSGVLMAALSRAHTGRMRDIVATVQAEQDEIIRAPLPGVLVVQGGPGTGKTAVALHRAAYLLYTHRFPLEGQGVLVVGPNPTFLRYIDQVLPSLGETGVEMSTAAGLYKQARPTATESPAAARLKGDPRMARFVRRAVLQRERPLRKAVRIPYGRSVLTLTPEASAEIVAAAKRRAGPHNARRRAVETLLWQHLSDQLTAQAERWAGPSRGRSGGEEDTGATVRSAAAAGPAAAGRAGRRPAPASRGGRGVGTHVAAPDGRGPVARPPGGQAADRGGRPGHPEPGRGGRSLPAAQCLRTGGPVDAGRHTPAGRGQLAARAAAPGTGGRAPAPHPRPHRRRRGPGPHAHGAAHGREALAFGVHDPGGGHSPGHGAMGGRRPGTTWWPTCRPGGVGGWPTCR